MPIYMILLKQFYEIYLQSNYYICVICLYQAGIGTIFKDIQVMNQHSIASICFFVIAWLVISSVTDIDMRPQVFLLSFHWS